MDEIIQQMVSWEEIGNHDKSEYRYAFGTAKIAGANMAITISMELNFIIPYANLDAIQEEIMKRAPDIQRVLFSFTYRDMIVTEPEIIQGYLPYMIHEKEAGRPVAVKAILDDVFTIEGGELTLYAIGEIAVEQLNETVAPLFEKKLAERFGIKKKITFVVHEERYQRLKELKRLQEETETAHAGTIIQAVEGDAVPICLITQDSGAVIIQGKLFKKKTTKTKKDRTGITLFVADQTTVILAKSFLTEEKRQQLDEYVHEGDIVKISGTAKFDQFERCTVILISAIERVRRTDSPKNGPESNPDPFRI